MKLWHSTRIGPNSPANTQALLRRRFMVEMFTRWCEVNTPCRIPGEFERVLGEAINGV